MSDHNKQETHSVLPKKLGGGPLGLGDPDDTTLRKVEYDVLVMKKVREKTKTEKCAEEFKAFNECAKKQDFFLVFNCRKENNLMKECSQNWFSNEQFIEDCKNEYIKERSEYRRTGITKRQKDFKNRVGSSF